MITPRRDGLWESAVLALERGFPLHAMVTSCGESEVDGEDYRWNGLERGRREFAVLQHTLAGTGSLRYGKRHFALGPGTLMVVPIPHDHEYSWRRQLSEGEPWRFRYVCVTGSEVMRAVRAAVAAGPVLTPDPDSPLIGSLADALELVRDHGRASPYRVSAVAYRIGMELLAACAIRGADPRHVEMVRRAQRLLREQLAEPVTVARIARELGTSRAHLTRLFRKTAGVAPHAYLEEERIAKAVDLMYATSLSVKEIGYACGYPDPHYFSKAFRRRTGLAPTDYRRSRM